MSSLCRRFLFVVLALSTSAAIAAGSAAEPSYFWPPAQDVAIFKDGCAYVIREGETEAGPDGVLTEGIPRPILGTLDVYSLTDGVEVVEVVAYYDTTERTARIEDTDTFYRRQIGGRVILEYDQQKLEGVLRAVLSPGNLLLETAEGSVLVPAGRITRFTVAGGVTLDLNAQAQKPRFRIRLAGAPRRVRLGLSYLEESWAWFPSYRINLRPNGQAELVLSATVVNNAEDVSGATLHLIVGVPNFMMRGTLTPMALDVDSGQYTALESRLEKSLLSQAFDNAQRGEVYARTEAAPAQANPAVPAGPVEDLFIYEKKGFTLGRGQRMQFELFRGQVPYQSIYKWEVPLSETQRAYSQGGRQQQARYQGEQTGQIWHYLRMANKTVVPWTTAPAMVVSGWQPISQDLMKYVPIGGTYDLRLTVAPDLKGALKEEEIERRSVRLYENDNYLQVTVRGTINLENLKKTPVQLEVAKDLWGEAKDTGGAKASKGAELLWNVNPRTKLNWQLELPAGGKRVLTYTYEFYVNI